MTAHCSITVPVKVLREVDSMIHSSNGLTNKVVLYVYCIVLNVLESFAFFRLGAYLGDIQA